MASAQKPETSEELNESWVELQQNPSMVSSLQGDLPHSHSSYNGNLEKLLIEAQRESRTPSRPNSKESSTRGSPKSPHSPNNEWVGDWREKQDPGTDWIWDWSSRPEIQPNSDWTGRFKHPTAKPGRHGLSVRHTRVMKNGVFSIENLPTLLLTHACTFFLGAAMMLIYVKKYCNWAVVTATLD
ncbi:hypothetical protein SNE40_007601 [Patella caerulea]|uniref:BCL2/adenovirus E1B 19 kDa protein-interacting protein 3 n=2 Tax=Patella caerulea TaxID=87958 RepID=A0AAN8K4W7_PATCE